MRRLILGNNSWLYQMIARECLHSFTCKYGKGNSSDKCDSCVLAFTQLTLTQWLLCKMLTSIYWALTMLQTQFQAYYIHWCIWSSPQTYGVGLIIMSILQMKNCSTEKLNNGQYSNGADLQLNMDSLALSLQCPPHWTVSALSKLLV